MDIGSIAGLAGNLLGGLGGLGGGEAEKAGPSEGDVEMLKALLESDIPGQMKATLAAEYLDQLSAETEKEEGGNGLMDMIGGLVEGIGGGGGLLEGLGGLFGGK